MTTAPKLPEGLEPVALPPDLEALMPEPAFRLRWHSISARYTVSKPDIGDTDVYTATQMRAAILAATERAAMKVEEVGPKEGALKLVTEGFAAAIRGDGRQT